MTEETRHKSAIVVLYTAAVILLLIASVLPQISFAKDSDASLVSVQVRKSMMGWNVYLAFDDPSVESGVLQLEGFRDGYPDSRHSLIAKFERVDGVCVANVVNNNYYTCDRIEVADFVVAPTNAGLNDLYIVPMTLGFVCVFAAFALMYRPVASAVHDGRIFTACQGFTSSKLKLDGKVIAKEKGRNVDYITATADGVVYFASFARPSKPSLAVNGVGVKSKKVDMAKKYNAELEKTKQIVVFSKCDLLEKDELKAKIDIFVKETKIKEWMTISSYTREGIEDLKKKILENLKKIPKKPPLKVEEFDFDKKDVSSIEITRHDDGSFEVSGGRIESLVRGVVLSDQLSFAYFQNRLKEMGVIDMLKARGMKQGDTVRIKDIEFEFVE